MNDQSTEKIKVHSTLNGKLYVKDTEFFGNSKVKSMIIKLLASSLYKHIKNSSKQLHTP